MILKCCFFSQLTTFVKFSPLVFKSFPFPRCPGKVLLCQTEACLEWVTMVCKTSPAVLAALTFPLIFPSNTYIYTFMGIFMRKSSLLFISSLTHSFSAKLKMPGMVLFETTYGSPGEGWGWHRFHKQLTGDVQLQGGCPWTIQTRSLRSAPEQHLLQVILLFLQCNHGVFL